MKSGLVAALTTVPLPVSFVLSAVGSLFTGQPFVELLNISVLPLFPFYIYIGLPFGVALQLFWSKRDIRLMQGLRQEIPFLVIGLQILIHLVAYYSVSSRDGLLVSQTGSFIIYLSYLWRNVGKPGGQGKWGRSRYDQLAFLFFTYIGFSPIIYSYVALLETVASEYYASLAGFIFSTMLISTDLVRERPE